MNKDFIFMCIQDGLVNSLLYILIISFILFIVSLLIILLMTPFWFITPIVISIMGLSIWKEFKHYK